MKCSFMPDFLFLFYFSLVVNIRVEIPLCRCEKLLADSSVGAQVNRGDLVTYW